MMRVINTDNLTAIVKQNEIDPVIMFGAGASATSGVPLARDMANQAIRWATAMHKGWNTDDPRIMESDIQRYLQSQPWFSTNMTVEDYYQHSMRLLNSPRELRRQFLFHVLNTVTQPSSGYYQLTKLVKQQTVRTLLTSNFDDRFRTAFGSGPLITISEPGEHHRINTAPIHPQLVHLHGRADHYMDRIMEEEVQELDNELASHLLPLLRDHPFIVVGYRGAEPSIMKTLLIDQVEVARTFPLGVFWCTIEGTDQESLSPLVKELAHKLGDNFTLIPIRGFDQFMDEFTSSISRIPLAVKLYPLAQNTFAPDELAFDMRPAEDALTCKVSQTALHQVAIEHSTRLDMQIPEFPDEAWYADRLVAIGLLTKDANGVEKLTNAAALLCGESGRAISPGHWVELATPDRPPLAIDGSLIQIYESLIERFEEINRPIRVKGNQSKFVQPYGTIALKELLANALIHREYETREPVKIWLDKQFVTIESPGGLDSALVHQLVSSDGMTTGEEFVNRIHSRDIGTRFTAYRNPNLAEAFWGLGYVDKAGSGVVDALKSLMEVGANAHFEIPTDNDRFIVTASMSHLDVDETTRTALPRRPAIYWSNVVEFLVIPDVVYRAKAKITHARECAKFIGSRRLPPFALRNRMLYTFADLTMRNSPFAPVASLHVVDQLSIEEVSCDVTTENVVPELLRKALEARMQQCGLWLDRRKHRAYYRCDRGNFRSIRYTTMGGRQTRRRVARWPKELNVGHCEHDAVNYSITQVSTAWALMLQPTYIVTLDGRSDQLPSNEHSSEVTRLQSEHYNPKVLADVRFWLRQLETSNGVICIDLGNAKIEISTRLIMFEGYSNSREENQRDHQIDR